MGNILFHLQFPAPAVTNQMTMQTFFESLDGWEESEGGSGAVRLDVENIVLETGITGVSWASIIQRLAYASFNPSWNKARSFEITARVTIGNDDTPQCHICTGNYQTNKRAFGFKFWKDRIEGWSGNNSAERVVNLITGLGSGWTATYKFKAVLTPGVKIEFYIDDVLLGTIIDRIPTGTTDAGKLLHAQVLNSTTVNHQILTGYAKVVQDL